MRGRWRLSQNSGLTYCRLGPAWGRNDPHGCPGDDVVSVEPDHRMPAGGEQLWRLEVVDDVMMTSPPFSTSGAMERQISMNHYGALAERHWKTHRPSQYSTLEDPTAFFTDLGEQISLQVQDLQSTWEAEQRAELNALPDLTRMGRLNAIRKSAEESVYAELIWPESSLETEPEQTTEGSGVSGTSREDRLWSLGAIEDEDGALMPANRQHPLWGLWATSTKDEATQQEKDSFTSAYREWLQETPGLVDLV